MSPAYTFALGEHLSARLYAAAWYVGHRFSDTHNLQPLQPFTQFNAGLIASYAEQWEAQFSCDNLTNVIGLTERDPRIIGSGVVNDAFLGRPIFGRSFTLTLSMRRCAIPMILRDYCRLMTPATICIQEPLEVGQWPTQCL